MASPSKSLKQMGEGGDLIFPSLPCPTSTDLSQGLPSQGTAACVGVAPHSLLQQQGQGHSQQPAGMAP